MKENRGKSAVGRAIQMTLIRKRTCFVGVPNESCNMQHVTGTSFPFFCFPGTKSTSFDVVEQDFQGACVRLDIRFQNGWRRPDTISVAKEASTLHPVGYGRTVRIDVLTCCSGAVGASVNVLPDPSIFPGSCAGFLLKCVTFLCELFLRHQGT